MQIFSLKCWFSILSMWFITKRTIKTVFWKPSFFTKMCSQNVANAIFGIQINFFLCLPHKLPPPIFCKVSTTADMVLKFSILHRQFQIILERMDFTIQPLNQLHVVNLKKCPRQKMTNNRHSLSRSRWL
jgi:hypothetical protein